MKAERERKVYFAALDRVPRQLLVGLQDLGSGVAFVEGLEGFRRLGLGFATATDESFGTG